MLDKYYLKSYTDNDTSVCLQYWYSVFFLGTATYTDERTVMNYSTPDLQLMSKLQMPMKLSTVHCSDDTQIIINVDLPIQRCLIFRNLAPKY